MNALPTVGAVWLKYQRHWEHLVMLRIVVVICGILLGLLAAAILIASGHSNVLVGLRYVIADPWGVTTLLDLGVGLLFVAVWLLAVGGEVLADRQLAVWRANPAHRGRVCRAGLWRYSRHPNYFFEWLHWWSYPLLAWGSPEWQLTLLGPALMLYTLLKVTGIPYTEQQALASRGDDYRAYQHSTSAFIPWFPKKENG